MSYLFCLYPFFFFFNILRSVKKHTVKGEFGVFGTVEEADLGMMAISNYGLKIGLRL